MQRYRGVRGQRRVEAILAAIHQCGGEVLRAPDPSVAPFEISLRASDRATVDLVCYAFDAGTYSKRPGAGAEQRIQVRFRDCSSRPQRLYRDESGRRLTLFFGVHAEKPLFIAVDPAKHDPSWFSESSRSLIELPEEELARAEQLGWHGWERERPAEGRHAIHPLENLQTEVVLAFRPEHFLRYLLFERIATGLDTGERHLLIDQIGEVIADAPVVTAPHRPAVTPRADPS